MSDTQPPDAIHWFLCPCGTVTDMKSTSEKMTLFPFEVTCGGCKLWLLDAIVGYAGGQLPRHPAMEITTHNSIGLTAHALDILARFKCPHFSADRGYCPDSQKCLHVGENLRRLEGDLGLLTQLVAGRVWVPRRGTRPCPLCQGLGEYPPDVHQSCPRCGGSGYVRSIFVGSGGGD